MTIGDKVVYVCLAGIPCDAVVRWVRPDGSVDIGCDVGSTKLHELTRIQVVDRMQPGTVISQQTTRE